jgi:hypothetical protein
MSTLFKDQLTEINEQNPLDSVEDDGLAMVNVSNWCSKNKRRAPRYVREDIVVALCETHTLSFGKELFLGFVELNDITSRGASIITVQYLATNKKISLHLRFQSKTTFKIPATIVYRINEQPYQYGVKFDEDNYELSDHLLKTQLKLIFR